MTKNRISVSLAPETLTEVVASLNRAKELLTPHLASLTKTERVALPKMSEKTVSFVSKTTEYARSNPEYAPTYFSSEELAKDLTYVNALKPVLSLCEQLRSDLEDTIMLAGSEAYAASLMYYGSVQMAAKSGQPGARPILEDLRQRFETRGKHHKSAS